MKRAVVLIGIVLVELATQAPRAEAHATDAPDLRYREHVGATVPPTVLRDDTGTAVRVPSPVGSRPAIIVPGYYNCGNLCGVVLQGVAAALPRAGLVAGRDVDVYAISIDPAETSADAHRRRADIPGGTSPGWHFLTGEAAPLLQAIGFEAVRVGDAPAPSRYAHPAGIVVVTRDGRIAGYLPGVSYAPDLLRPLIAAADRGAPQAAAHASWMRCFDYDPQTGRYTPIAINIVRAAGIAGALGLVITWLALRRRRS